MEDERTPAGRRDAASGAAPADGDAAVLRRYSSVPEMVTVVAYVEVRAILLGWAGVPQPDPADLCRRAITSALDERRGLWHPSTAAFGAHVRGLLRGRTAAVLFRAAGRLGPVPWHQPLAIGQIGDVAGLEVIFHHAAEASATHRERDPRVLALAVSLTDYVRAHVSRRLPNPPAQPAR